MRGVRPGVVAAAAVVALFGFAVSNAIAQPDYKVVHSFSSDDGAGPVSPLIRASDGYFYGTATGGGLYGKGVVFRVDETGALFHVVHDFDGSDGTEPAGALAEPTPPDGHLYGTACLGGAHSSGTVFRVDLSGDAFQVLRHLDPATDGSLPCEAPTFGPDGRLYGTARSGGAHNLGTIFALEPTGDGFGVIRDCDLGDCAAPTAGVVAGPDGLLYGASYNNVMLPHGFVFHVGTDGQNFQALGPDLGTYSAPLSFDSNGLLYGAVDSGLFRMNTSGGDFLTRTVPASTGVRQGPDGRMYGTALGGGQYLQGTIFRIDYDVDVFATILRDCGGDGSWPAAPMILGDDGSFYGTTEQGGTHDDGVVYRLIPIPIYVMMPPTGPASGGQRAGVYAWNFHVGATLQVGGVDAEDVVADENTRTITGTIPPLAPGKLHDVTVRDLDGIWGTERRMYLADFLDVPAEHPFHWGVEWLVRKGVTAGCGAGEFCPLADVTRAQMAVFLLKAMHGESFSPPPCEGLFDDVACAPEPDFAVDWIEELFREGVTSGCGPGIYCPAQPVRRDQMAVFLLRGMRGADYAPPPCNGLFEDVPCAPVPAFAVDWIEELSHSQITAGCSTAPLRYCPATLVPRQQMAVFLTTAFDLNQ